MRKIAIALFAIAWMSADANAQSRSVLAHPTTGVLIFPPEATFRSANGFLGLGLAEVSNDLGVDFSELTAVGSLTAAEFIVIQTLAGPRLITRSNLAALIGGASSISGGVIIYNDAGTATAYLPASDTDVARGTALTTAVAAHVATDTIYVHPAVYDMAANRIALADNANLLFDGATIQSTAVLTSAGAIIRPGNNSVIRGGTIQGTAASGVFQAAIGINSDIGETAKTGFVIQNVTLNADTDGLYLRSAGACTAVLRGCKFVNKYDGIALFTAAHVIDVYDPEIVVAGPSGTGAGIARGINAQSGTIRVFSGSMSVTAGGANVNVGANAEGGSTIELHDVSIFTTNGSMQPRSDLSNSSSTIRVTGGYGSGTNGAYTVGTGTITYSDSAELLTVIKTVDGSGSGLDADTLRATTPSAAGLSMLSAANAAAQGALLTITDLAGTLSVAKGGTGQTSAQAAMNALAAASGALAQGDVFYFDGTNFVRLAAGTSGQLLQTLGAGANPAWATVGALTDGDKGDITVSASGATWTVDNNAIALTTDTTGNYVADVAGTANEITSTHTPAEGSTATLSLHSAVTRDTEWDTAAEINTATTDDDFATLTGTQTLTNKSIDAAQLTGSIADARLSANVSLLGSAIAGSEVTDNTLDFADIANNATIDNSFTITGAAGNDIQIIRTLTNGTAENGFSAAFTASDTGAATTSQFGFKMTNSASTEGLDAMFAIDNNDADDAVVSVFKLTNAGGNFTNIFDNEGVLITGAELNRLDGKDAALIDANDAVGDSQIPAGVTRDTEWDTVTEINAATTDNDVATLAGAESLTNKKLGSLTSNGFVKTSGGDGTLSVDTATYSTASSTDTLTNKTFDGAGTGNVLKFKNYIYLTHPHNADGTGATIGTTATAITYGHATFSASADQAANYVEYRIQVPTDIDTSVALRAKLKFQLGNTDTGLHRYVLSMVDQADSASATGTVSDAINMDFAGDGSGANGDVETVGWTTLTGWAAALAADNLWVIRLARDGDDGTNDTSTVVSAEMGLVIEYGASQ